MKKLLLAILLFCGTGIYANASEMIGEKTIAQKPADDVEVAKAEEKLRGFALMINSMCPREVGSGVTVDSISWKKGADFEIYIRLRDNDEKLIAELKQYEGDFSSIVKQQISSIPDFVDLLRKTNSNIKMHVYNSSLNKVYLLKKEDL